MDGGGDAQESKDAGQKLGITILSRFIKPRVSS
jgi:hypothetical protein